MIKLLSRLLSRQDPSAPHTPLTRIIVSGIILVATVVLHGFYGLLAAVTVYLFGVELLGIGRDWMFLPFLITLLSGCWKGAHAIADYWENHGHG